MKELSAAALAASLLLTLPASLPGAGRLKAKIIDRHDSGSAYTYIVPQRTQLASTANLIPSTMPERRAYSVQGTTFALQMADGRVAVVNCASKINLTQWIFAQRRSCRMPIEDEVEAEFKGNRAKLFWPAADGSKLESETYQIIAVYSQPPR